MQPQAAAVAKQATKEISRTLAFRGKFNDSNGNHMTGVVGVLFAIYEQPKGGAPLWQEVQNIELNSRGRFSAVVGSTKKDGIPLNLFTNEKTMWLGIQVLLPGEVERPRMRLVNTDDSLVADSLLEPMAPENSAEQPSAAEVQEASSEPTDVAQPGSQLDQPRTTPIRRARRRLHRPMPAPGS
jgi:hypothetical protein